MKSTQNWVVIYSYNPHTFIPVLVASFTAFNNISYLGLKVTVKAQSIILPEREKKIIFKLTELLTDVFALQHLLD